MSLVTVQAGENRLVAAITNEGVKELQPKQKDQVTAVVKSTEVMLIKGGGQRDQNQRSQQTEGTNSIGAEGRGHGISDCHGWPTSPWGGDHTTGHR